MSMNATPIIACADLGDPWLRDQTARLHQRHLQFRRHYRLDVDALLARAASLTRAGRPAESPTVRRHASTDQIERTMIEAFDPCARGIRPSARLAEALAD